VSLGTFGAVVECFQRSSAQYFGTLRLWKFQRPRWWEGRDPVAGGWRFARCHRSEAVVLTRAWHSLFVSSFPSPEGQSEALALSSSAPWKPLSMLSMGLYPKCKGSSKSAFLENRASGGMPESTPADFSANHNYRFATSTGPSMSSVHSSPHSV
jgi:hypothetical protein